MNLVDKKVLLNALLDLQNTPDDKRLVGICGELRYRPHVSRTMVHYLGKFNETWPLYSGCSTYPVPSPDGRLPEQMYGRARDSHENFRWIGPYGDLRKSLLAHIISELEKEIQNDH